MARNGAPLFSISTLLFYYRFHVFQPFLEAAADHGFHAHERTDGLAEEIALAGHGPGDERFIALGLEGEFDVGGVREWPDEFEFEPDQFARLALLEGHQALADIVVA